MTKKEFLQNRLMRMRQLTEYTSLSRAYIYDKIAAGEFPRGNMISQGIRAWEKSEIDAWLDQRMGKNA